MAISCDEFLEVPIEEILDVLVKMRVAKSPVPREFEGGQSITL